ncbi:MAG: DNA polymerase [Nitrospiraceae bacterium]
MITPQTLYNRVKFPVEGPDLDNVNRLDMGALPMINRMGQNGLMVDLSHFERMSKLLGQDMERITEEVKTITGHYINIDSGDQVSDLLFKKLHLKQVRPKMTKSGDRESVEEEVLTAIQHQHPVVTLIQEYKEYSKLDGTYVRPMPKLAKKTSFGVWKMYPNFGCTRIPSGRLNCKEPNLLAMPNRTERGRQVCEGFITRPGWVYLSVDECLHPTTLVKTLTGPIEIQNLKVGDPILTLSGDRIKWGRVTVSQKMISKMAYKITFDNGESVISSFDHRWPIQSRRKKYGLSKLRLKTTEELMVGERMVPCRESAASGYKTWYTYRGATVYTLHHHLVADAYFGPRPDGHHIHHKDGNKLNNDPSNLTYIDANKHASIHSSETWAKQDHTYRIQKLREGLKKRRSYKGSNNPRARLSPKSWERIRQLKLRGWCTKDIAEVFGVTPGYVGELIRGRRGRGPTENHTITHIEPVGVQPMWGITVDPDHTYVLDCGVVTHNSQIEPRVVAHRSGDRNLRAIYFNEEDIYSDFATSAFKLSDERYKSDTGKWIYPTVHLKKHRFPGKTCTLASIYDVTGKGLAEQMPVVCTNCDLPAKEHNCGHFSPHWTEDRCQDLINSFYIRYREIMTMRMKDHQRARQFGYVWSDWGRILHVAAVRSVLNWVVSAALREAGNFPIQEDAQGTVKLTMAQVDDDFQDMGIYEEVANPLLQIHDELLFECREDMADEVGGHVASRFENCVHLEVPIKAGVAKAPVWGLMPK